MTDDGVPADNVDLLDGEPLVGCWVGLGITAEPTLPAAVLSLS